MLREVVFLVVAIGIFSGVLSVKYEITMAHIEGKEAVPKNIGSKEIHTIWKSGEKRMIEEKSGTFLIKVESHVTREELEEILGEQGLKIEKKLGVKQWYRVARVSQNKRFVDLHAHFKQHGSVLKFKEEKRNNIEPMVDFDDPDYPSQWHLNNTGQDNATAGNDINIDGAWEAGYTGSGILVSIVDDGLDHTHTDLMGKFDQSASYDFSDNDTDPTPPDLQTDHGTACGGLVAATADNSKCGVGVAYEAELSACVILGDPAATTAQTAECFTTYGSDTGADISSNSWGIINFFGGNNPIYSGTQPVEMDAFQQAASEGRDGKGLVIIKAAGNSFHPDHLSCAAEARAASPFLIMIGATGASGRPSSYTSQCEGVLVNAPSSTFDDFEGKPQPGIVTTTTGDSCRDDFGGTSASTPIVSGIAALMLEANPDLNYREVFTILAETAKPVNVSAAHWEMNGAGRYFSKLSGYGVVDAAAAVDAAMDYNGVEFTYYNETQSFVAPQNFTSTTPYTATVTIGSEAAGKTAQTVSMQLFFSHAKINEVSVKVTSPDGTVSTLFAPFLTGPQPIWKIPGEVILTPLSYSAALVSPLNLLPTVRILFTNDSICSLYDAFVATPTTDLSGIWPLLIYQEGQDCTVADYIQAVEDMGGEVGFFIPFPIGNAPPPDEGVMTHTIPVASLAPALGNELLILASSFGNPLTLSSSNFTYNDAEKVNTLQFGDLEEDGFAFKSERHWGETVEGDWLIEVEDTEDGDHGSIHAWDFAVVGAEEKVPDDDNDDDGDDNVPDSANSLHFWF